ncbi:hypothetical protein [Streptomyces tubercidicus]|uniref:hypothetical protein n=1 Tax=Streptomyces tubercidicus TaxID=47759 RepID=UPI002E18A464
MVGAARGVANLRKQVDVLNCAARIFKLLLKRFAPGQVLRRGMAYGAGGRPVGGRRAARLLPWTTPDGKTCVVVGDGDGYVSRIADGMAAVQLDMADDLLGHADDILGDRKATLPEVRYLASQLAASLREVRRVAESGGGRLLGAADSPRDPC